MALTVTLVGTFNSGTPGSSFVITDPGTPPAGSLILLSFFSRIGSGTVIPNTATITGKGVTWVNIAVSGHNGASDQAVQLFRALGTPTAGNITIDFGGQSQSLIEGALNYSSPVDTSGSNGSAAVVQSGTTLEEGTNTTLTATLSAFGSVNNVGFGAASSGGTITAGSGFTELSNTAVQRTHETEYEINNNVVSWGIVNDGSFKYGIAIEIKFAPNLTISVVDNITIAETTTARLANKVSIIDNITISDVITDIIRGKARDISVFDPINVSESITTGGVARASIIDSATVGEQVGIFQDYYKFSSNWVPEDQSINSANWEEEP